MRAFAVLMMVQGHTVDSLLAEEYRTMDSLFYSTWHTFRGFTAPIFMFTSGVVFTYLLRTNTEPFFKNPRVIKGIKRFFLLLGIGYLLRYPTYKIFDFSDVTEKQWLIFFSVDALHLIAFGILFVLILAFIAEKTKLKDWFIFSAGGLFFILLYPLVKNIGWSEIFPLPIAAYFYRDTGSLFPLFPWAGYVIGGGILGSYLAKNSAVCSSKNFSVKLLIGGVVFVAFSILINQLGKLTSIYSSIDVNSFSIVFYRVGIVLVLNSIMAMIATRIVDLPKLVKMIGRNTLLIYGVHLVILYGCAWIPGLYMFYSRSIGLELTLTVAVSMILLMTGMVIIVEKIRISRKNKISTVTV